MSNKKETIIRMLRFFLREECRCKGAIIPYPDGSRACPHEIAKQELAYLEHARDVQTNKTEKRFGVETWRDEAAHRLQEFLTASGPCGDAIDAILEAAVEKMQASRPAKVAPIDGGHAPEYNQAAVVRCAEATKLLKEVLAALGPHYSDLSYSDLRSRIIQHFEDWKP